MVHRNLALEDLPTNDEAPKRSVSIVNAAPKLASQHNSAAVFGLNARAFLDAVREYGREGHKVGRHGKTRLVDASAFAAWLLSRERRQAEQTGSLLAELGLKVVG